MPNGPPLLNLVSVPKNTNHRRKMAQFQQDEKKETPIVVGKGKSWNKDKSNINNFHGNGNCGETFYTFNVFIY